MSSDITSISMPKSIHTRELAHGGMKNNGILAVVLARHDISTSHPVMIRSTGIQGNPKVTSRKSS